LCTKEEFIKAVTEVSALMGFDQAARKTPLDEQYENCVSQAVKVGGIRTKRELAMFLTHVIITSEGLVIIEEPRCLIDKCINEYNHKEGYKGQYYYGRGYLQLVVIILFKIE